MLWRIAKMEIDKRFKMISTYVYFLINFGISFLIMNIAGGAIPGAQMNMFRSGENIFVNSPAMISIFSIILFYFNLIPVASVFGHIAVNDFENNSFSLIFTKPVKKIALVAGKFLAGFIIGLFIFTGVSIGLFLGTIMPYLESVKIGPNIFYAYIQPYILYILPNLFFTGIIFFFVALCSRKILNSFIAGIVLFIGYMSSSALSSDFVNQNIAALCDPFGINSIMNALRYWSPEQINQQFFPLSGMLLYNRLIWISVSLVIGFFFYRYFQMVYTQDKKKKHSKLIQTQEDEADYKSEALKMDKLASVDKQYHHHFLSVCKWLKLELKGIFSNRYFYVIMIAYLFFLIGSATQVGKIYGTVTMPVTYIVLEILTGSYLLFSIILSTFYAGELIWKERINRSEQLIDVLPFQNAIPFISKFLAIMIIQFIFMLMIIIVGLITQVSQGYFHIQFSQYLFDLIAIRSISVIIFTFLAMFFQVLLPNKYAGYFAVILVYGLQMIMGMMDLDHNLIQFNSAPSFNYSEMNHYGHYLTGFYAFKSYWLLVSIVLALFAAKLWVRGKEEALKVRFSYLRKEGFNRFAKSLSVIIVVIIVLASWIFYNTNIVNKYYSSKKIQKLFAKYEKQYKHLEQIPQPRIVEINVNNEIYPKERILKVNGYYWLKNKTQMPMDTLIVSMHSDVKSYDLKISESNHLVKKDDLYGLNIYQLSQPLLSGDSLKLSYSYQIEDKGFQNDGGTTEFVENGTFYHSDYFPSLGYQSSYEISDNSKRKKHNLAPKERMASINDLEARNNVYISDDADWVRLESVISTSDDQMAFAPGDLIKHWKKNNRNYYHYRLNSPALNYFTFVSGRYTSEISSVNGVSVELYFHPEHTLNIPRIMEAAKHSLDYCSKNFAPYPHKVLRIIEIPRYSSYAQSIPTMIPFSEGLGYIAKVRPDDPKDIDYPYYITAHEVSHQWWAHQLIGADVQGSTMLSEAFAQYTALMCMKEKFGDQKMGRFLSYELDSYLVGRSNESKKELPLYLVENQQYIHYNKGSLVMYAMQDYIGEKNMNAALNELCMNYRFKEPPYPVSTDFFPYLEKYTPDSLKTLIPQFYKQIVLYDFGIKTAKVKNENKMFKLTVMTENKKVMADSLGKEKEIPLNDWVEIAVYEKAKKDAVYLQKHLINQKNQKIEIVLSTKPEKVVINPLKKLIDKNRENDESKL